MLQCIQRIYFKVHKLLEFKKIIESVDSVKFKLPNGELIPSHFHITEVGSIKKDFIDCGGTIRNESFVGFQLWKQMMIWSIDYLLKNY